MANGYSLHIGLNSVDPAHYAGWSGDLNACEADANDMADIAQASGYEAKKLLTKDGTRAAVTSAINAMAAKCKAGDIAMLTYSGHGGQLPDQNGDEPDGQDETWCLYDGEWVDDEIHAALGAFAKGVRVLVLSDSCHSGTVAKDAMIMASIGRGSEPVARALPPDLVSKVYFAHKAFYDPILKNKKLKEVKSQLKCSVLLISGCQDNQLSMDGPFNGAFTGALKKVWNGGTFVGGYDRFHKRIQARLPATQSPNLFWASAPDLSFQAQKPFTI